MHETALPFRVLVVTDEDACLRASRSLLPTFARMLDPLAREQGARVAVLLRMKGASEEVVEEKARALLPLVRRAGARLLVHTHVALVDKLGLDGAHVDSKDDGVRAREALPRGALLGASRHAGDALDPTALAPFDYATLSPIWRPTSKLSHVAPLGVEGLRLGCATSGRPLVALGGIDDTRAASCFDAGAAAVGVLGVVQATRQPAAMLQALLRQAAPR